MNESRRATAVEIQRWLTIDTTAQEFSARIFGPVGLLAALSLSAEERRQVVETPLYLRAMARFEALGKQENEEFDRDIDELNRLLSGDR